MIRRGLIGFPVALLLLAILSLYRETLGVPLFYLVLLTAMLFWITQATSWNILSGYSGYFSFGQAAYVGVGAYTTAVLFGRHGFDFYLTILVSAGLSAVLALAIGFVAFRLRALRGEIFALLTLAVPFILAALARVNQAIDGGQGIIVPIPPFPESLGRFQDFLYLMNLVLAVGAVATAYFIRHSRFGWALAGIHDAEDVAEGLGVATFRYKLQALVASAVIGGVGGSLFALQIGFVAVDSVFHLTVPLFVIVMSVLGGRSHWFGPVAGAVLVVLLQDRLTASGFDQWQLIALGGILALLVVLAPEGLYARWRSRPLPALLAAVAVAVIAGLAVPGAGLLDALLAGGLAATFVALLPRRRTPSHPPRSRNLPGNTPVEEVQTGVLPGKLRDLDARGMGGVVVECRDVARHFGGVRALDGINLTIREGEIVGLVGPNGSGKTTLVSLLSGTLRPTSGSIHIGGRDLARMPTHRVAHGGVARTYQIPRPFGSMTVRDNVAMALMFGRSGKTLAAARRDAQHPLELVGLAGLTQRYPQELNLHQRQLLEMARALAADPKVLLLDEALAGLNPAEIDNAVEVVRRVHDTGVSIVIVEHLLRVVTQLATRIVVLDRGVLLADGEPARVLSDPAVVSAYLGKRAHA
jgi:branched-chain amino acid transport system permease protein